MFYSWYLSYPVSIDSLGDSAFNHISPLFWFSLSPMLVSVYLIALAGGRYSKWISVVGIFTLLNSLSYFYYTLPTSDSQYFRGLTEYFVSSNNIPAALKTSQLYFEWPNFFMFNKMAISVMGTSPRCFEFISYFVLGFLLTTILYAYFSKASKEGAFFAVIGFSLAMWNFLNYQWVPFTLSFALFLLIVMLDAKWNESHRKQSLDIVTMVLVAAISFTHPFVPLFYFLYTLARYLFSREGRYVRLFIFSICFYMLVQVFQAPLSFVRNLQAILTRIQSTEYSSLAQRTLQVAPNSLDAVCQLFSRSIVIVVLVIFGIGFTASIIKRKTQLHDNALLVSGIVHLFLGGVTQVLGSRAIALLFIPVCCSGVYYLFQTRFRSYLKFVFLILLVLWPFVFVHWSLSNDEIFFQTKEAYDVSNFMIDHYDWTSSRARYGLTLAHFRVVKYLESRQPLEAFFETDFSPLFPKISQYETIVYTVGLGMNLLKYNYTKERILDEMGFDQVYCNGFSYIWINSSVLSSR
jgi:hypothetical protein